MQLKLSPSGPQFAGAPGDMLRCVGGSDWEVFTPPPPTPPAQPAQAYIQSFNAPGSVLPGDGSEHVVFGSTGFTGNTTRQLVTFSAYGVVGGAGPGPGPAQLILTAYVDGIPRSQQSGFGYWVSPPLPAPPGLAIVQVGAQLSAMALGVGPHTFELRGRYYDPAGGGGAAFWQVYQRVIIIQDVGVIP